MANIKTDLDDRLALTKGDLWLVTGAAGFIGSNIVETLLRAGQAVRAIDNFATGHQSNIDRLYAVAKLHQKNDCKFEFINSDIRSFEACENAVRGVTYVLHQAGLGSVPRSIVDPIATNEVNITGFLNVLEASRRAAVKSFVYAASSSTYGDSPSLPKVEDKIGNPLSPYAVTKLVNEQYANVYFKTYGFRATGLRYFNVFGPAQDPNGAYAAVIPKWIMAMVKDQEITINGDGETSRDFCFVDNTVQANLRAALGSEDAKPEVYNVAFGGRTTLNQLFEMIKVCLAELQINYNKSPIYAPFRKGDVAHSHADISKAQIRLGYAPTHDVRQGLEAAMPWYIQQLKNRD